MGKKGSIIKTESFYDNEIIIIKTFGLSQFIYVMQSVGLPNSVLTKINRIFFSFLWKRKYTNRKAFEKVKRKTMYSNNEHGGLNMINVELMQTSFMLNWALKLISPGDEVWKHAPLNFLNKIGGKKVFDSKVTQKEFKGDNLIQSNFWRDVVKIWCSYNTIKPNPQDQVKLNEAIFDNDKIKYKGTVLFLPEAIKRGIYHIKDVSNQNHALTFLEFIDKHGN